MSAACTVLLVAGVASWSAYRLQTNPIAGGSVVPTAKKGKSSGLLPMRPHRRDRRRPSTEPAGCHSGRRDGERGNARRPRCPRRTLPRRRTAPQRPTISSPTARTEENKTIAPANKPKQHGRLPVPAPAPRPLAGSERRRQAASRAMGRSRLTTPGRCLEVVRPLRCLPRPLCPRRGRLRPPG